MSGTAGPGSDERVHAAAGDTGAAGSGEPAPSPGAAAGAPTRRRPLAALRDAWRAASLQRRLVTITAVLLGAGLVVAAVTAATLLQRSLLAPVDDKLDAEAQVVAENALAFLTSGGGQIVPTDYYVRVQTAGQQAALAGHASQRSYGTPRVADLTADEAAATRGEPFTVSSTRAGSGWRVVAYPFSAPDGTTGSVVVGLPLKDIHSTLVQMSRTLAASGVLIVVAGVLVGGMAVRRSLRPLGEIGRASCRERVLACV